MKILELADYRSEVARTLKSKTPEIINHLIKLYLYPDNSNRDHWISEIYSFINSVPKLKSSKKFPSQEFIYKNTYNIWKDNLSNRINSVIEDYGVPVNLDKNYIEVCDSICCFYFLWLSKELSSKGVVSCNSISHKIKELLN